MIYGKQDLLAEFVGCIPVVTNYEMSSTKTEQSGVAADVADWAWPFPFIPDGLNNSHGSNLSYKVWRAEDM